MNIVETEKHFAIKKKKNSNTEKEWGQRNKIQIV